MEPFRHLQRLTGMTDSTLYRNLLNVFNDATPEEYDAGVSWYHDANALIGTMADETGIEHTRMAGIVAALSPRVRWATNLDAALRMARAARNRRGQPIVAGLPINRNRAWLIARTGNIDFNIRGPKVNAFYRNLIGDLRAVTIDVWMLNAAGVKYANASNIRDITAAVTSIATDVGLEPAEVQAIIWVVCRDRWAIDKRGTINS